MLVHELIQNQIRPLIQSNTVGDAIAFLEHEGLGYYPIVDEKSQLLVGEASYNYLIQHGDDKSAEIQFGSGVGQVLRDTNHILDAAHIMIRSERATLPVVDRAGNYLGMVSKVRLIDAVTKILNLGDVGTVLMIEMKPRDFMLSDVIRIIESEGARILTLTVQAPTPANDAFRISVKLNLDDMSRVGAALRRYGYIIVSESVNSLTDIDLLDKADEFMRYLDI